MNLSQFRSISFCDKDLPAGSKSSMRKVAIAIAIALIGLCAQLDRAQSSNPQLPPPTSSAATIPAGQVFIMQLDTPLHTRIAKRGDKVEFHTAADVTIDNKVLIPNRSLIQGQVTKSKRAGLLFGRAELQIHFVDVKLPDGTLLPFQAIITRAGFDPVNSKNGEDPRLKGEAGPGGDIKAAASAGAQGAIIGVLSAGPKGAVYGAGVGVAATAIGSMLRRGPDIDLPRSTMFEARFEKPLEISAKSVLAQNSPAADATNAALNTSADYPANDRPVLRRPQKPPPTDEASVPKPETSEGAPTLAPVEVAKAADPAAAGVTISVKVKMVQVDAVVRNRSGQILENLRLEDFRVYEDNVLQELASFSQDELPLAVALVVDRSGSVAPYISELRRIATRALYNLKQQDEVCLLSFAQDVQRLEDLTTDRQTIANAIDRIHAGGGTDIMDALYEAVRYLANAAPDRRHAIILISDNQQTTNPRTSEHEVITSAHERDTVLYSLKTSGTRQALGNQLPNLIFGDSVNKVAQETGGEVIKVTNTRSLDGALGSVISRLRTRYSLGYYPSSSSQNGAFHSITVRLADKFGKAGSDYFIAAKRGHYAVQVSKSVAVAQP
jgi:Ca-activated chloride channel family protein